VLLAVDIGNTNIVAGVFDGDRLLTSWRLETDRRKTTDEYAALLRTLLDHRGFKLTDAKGFAISSTVPPLTATFRRLSETYFDLPPVIAGPTINTGIVIAITNPAEIGPDRIVNSLAAMKRHRLRERAGRAGQPGGAAVQRRVEGPSERHRTEHSNGAAVRAGTRVRRAGRGAGRPDPPRA
jgi:hypothetical protein